MASMHYTLTALQARVADLIKNQGPNAPVAWWIYTSEDVVKMDEDGNETQQPPEMCESVLVELDEYDHIHTAIHDAIDTSIGSYDRGEVIVSGHES